MKFFSLIVSMGILVTFITPAYASDELPPTRVTYAYIGSNNDLTWVSFTLESPDEVSIVAIYDDTGKLLTVRCVTIRNLSIVCPNNATTIKALLWNPSANMTPVCRPGVITRGTYDKPDGSKGYYSWWSEDFKINQPLVPRPSE